MFFDNDEEEEEDLEAYEAEQRRYGWCRKMAFFNEIESLWQDYLEVLGYPNTDFIDYLAKNCSYANDRIGAKYLIWVWKNVMRFSPKHLN